MVRVLFVCLGNICRSPMAEAIFRDQVKEEGLTDQIMVDSAGTGDWHIGKVPHHGTRDILQKANVSYEGIRARQINENDLEQFDYIIAMDTSNLSNIKQMAGNSDAPYIGRLLDFVPESELSDVPDPYFTGNFDEVFQLVKDGCNQLLQFIREREGL